MMRCINFGENILVLLMENFVDVAWVKVSRNLSDIAETFSDMLTEAFQDKEFYAAKASKSGPQVSYFCLWMIVSYSLEIIDNNTWKSWIKSTAMKKRRARDEFMAKNTTVFCSLIQLYHCVFH